MKTGLLWLEGPLQAWGHDSRFGRRDTLQFPTRSGILGMMCAALGKPGEQREWLEKMRPYKQQIIAYERDADDQKSPRPGLLRDFHMVGSGYDRGDKWQDLLIPKTSEGKAPVGSGSRLTWRHYLQDKAFAAILELPDDEAEQIAAAMQNPRWPLCLGRKCCIPSDLIWRGIWPDFESAKNAADAMAAQKSRSKAFLVKDGEYADGNVLTLSDVPLCFGPYKEYTDRMVTVVPV